MLSLATLTLPTLAADDFTVERGVGIAQMVLGNYSEAIRIFQKLADAGDSEGEFYLGEMYDEGKGVSQDYEEAEKWYRKSADQNYLLAQTNLGYMYLRIGKIFPGYVWLNIAASNMPPGRLRDETTKNRDLAANHMTSAQIVEAQRLAQRLRPNSSGH
jgi:TPR repeat protein